MTFYNRNTTASVSDPYSSSYDPDSPSYDSTRDPSSSNYFERGTTSETGAETKQDAENTVDADVEQGGFFDKLIDMFNHGSRVDEAYTREMNAQAAALAQSVPTRDGPIMMCANYLATPHPQLKTMVTENVNPDSVGESGDMWISAGNAMTRFQSGVASAINNSESDWKGTAGDSARGFMASVGTWVGDAGKSAQLAGTQTNLQAAAASEAKRAMPEPVDFDLAAANRDLQSTNNPFTLITKLNDYQAKYDAQQAAHQQAATVVGSYDSSLAGASTMPAFGPPPAMGTTTIATATMNRVEESRVEPVNPNGTNGTRRPRQSGTPGDALVIPKPPPGGIVRPVGTDDPNDPGGPGRPGGPVRPGDPNRPGDPGGPGGPGGPTDGTTPSGDLPGGLPGPGGFPGGSGNQSPGQNQGIPGGPMPMGGFPGGPGGGRDFERGRGFGPGGSGGYGGGPGGSGSGGPGGRGGGLGGMGGGPGGALAAEGGAMRGGAGAAGRGGGMMPMGGQRGEDEEDGEHQRPSFLVEGDPDGVFGTDQPTAPPVIGE
jgi:hypothetical protein